MKLKALAKRTRANVTISLHHDVKVQGSSNYGYPVTARDTVQRHENATPSATAATYKHD